MLCGSLDGRGVWGRMDTYMDTVPLLSTWNYHNTVNWLYSIIKVGLPCSSTGKEPACDSGHQGLIPGLGSSSREGNGNPLHPVFLPGEFHGQRNLVGYSPWGHKELDTTERLTLEFLKSGQLYISEQVCLLPSLFQANLLFFQIQYSAHIFWLTKLS